MLKLLIFLMINFFSNLIMKGIEEFVARFLGGRKVILTNNLTEIVELVIK